MQFVIEAASLLFPGTVGPSQDPGTRVELLMTLLLLVVAVALGPLIARAGLHVPVPNLPRRVLLFLPFVTVLLLQAVLATAVPPRSPRVSEEFHHLLVADNVLTGRLSSTKPTLQGMILAAGRLLTSNAVTGPALVSALLASVLTWAMLPWLPLGWAVFGGALAGIRIGVFSYWANSYWGGAHVAFGGSLMFGAVPRLAHDRRYLVPFAVGAALVVWSQPILGLAYVALMGGWAVLSRQMPPLMVLLVIAAVGLVRAGAAWAFFIGPLLTLPLLLAWRRVGTDLRWPLFIAASFFVLTAITTSPLPHDIAAATAILVLITSAALRDLWETRSFGRFYVSALPAACLLVGLFSTVASRTLLPISAEFHLPWHRTGPGGIVRAEVESRIRSNPGKHLVLVRYPSDHDRREEWVHNGAAPDAQQLLWGHEVGSNRNSELLKAYPDRRVWLVEPRPSGTRVSPYRQ
jgi:hypothetical protein